MIGLSKSFKSERFMLGIGGVSRLLCKRPRFVFGDGVGGRGQFAFPGKVLLVDDDAAVRDMMTVTLEVAAANVTEALRLIATESFDALITDPAMALLSLARCATLNRSH
jgi:hypothetical protein